MSVAPSKAAVLAALHQRLAALEEAKRQQQISIAATSPSPAPPTAAAAPAATQQNNATPPVARTPLEEAKALLAAKIAARNASLGTNGAVNVSPPVASSGSAAAESSVASSAGTPAAPVRSSAPKVNLCRSWLTCSFGARCRFLHPTVATQPFFDYGGRVLMHLNAATLVTAASAGINTSPAANVVGSSTMPPVLLLVLALMAAARTDPTQPPAIALGVLWAALKEQLAGTRDLPPNQDDLLNSMGLPTTAAVLIRAADGQPVQSTDAFRNMYASVFIVTRSAGQFIVSHTWDEARRMRLQEAAELAESLKAAKQKRTPHAQNGNTRASTDASAEDTEADMYRKRKRVPDSDLADLERSGKSTRLGLAYPEDAVTPIAPASVAPAATRFVSSSSGSRIYSLDAGADLGGSTNFVRGGIVTELSLLGPPNQQALKAAQQAAQPAVNPYEDEFTRAIRRQREVSTHATYTLRTNRIASGKGFDMLQKMNWRHGQGLGKRRQGRIEPLEVKFRADRTGL